jgi:2-oxoisovalerate dehydrogenase E1 component beta subunit
MVHVSVEAATSLQEAEGISVEVLDLRTLLPLDEDAVVDSVKRTGKLLVVHEDTRTGGIAGEIAMRVNEKAFEWLDGPILRVTAIDAPVPYSASLEDYFLPQVEDVVTAARYLAKY